MSYIILLSGFLIAFVAGWIIIPKVLLISHKKKLFDVPDARKVHTRPIPRLGGITFFPVILIALGLVTGVCHFCGHHIEYPSTYDMFFRIIFLIVGLTLLYLVGITDDLIGVGYRYKFVIQIFSATLFVVTGLWFNSLAGLLGIYEVPTWIGMPLTVITVVYITNAINLIDGVDGLASGLSCIALSVLGIAFTVNNQYMYALLAFSCLGVVIPFWCYNVFGNENRGRKLFMGDTGSLTLGYILSFLFIRYSFESTSEMQISGSKMIFAFSTLLVPLFDVVRVVLVRLRNKTNPFMPDRNHFHHKLLRMGLRSRAVMTSILLVSLFFILLNALLMNYLNITFILIIDIICWILLHLGINWKIRQVQKIKQELTYHI